MLTITIPTYNRNTLLRKTLEKLVPQLTAECRLVILDNVSPTPVSETLNGLLHEGLSFPWQIVRHPINIGGAANVLRCFEYAASPWLWLLCDDDPPQEGAVARAFAAIHANPDASMINFTAPWVKREKTIIAQGRKDLLEKLDNYGGAMFLSNNLWQPAKVVPQIRWGYNFITSLNPQLAMLWLAMGETGTVVLRPDELVVWEEPDPATRWSLQTFSLVNGLLGDMNVPNDERRLIQKHVLTMLPSVSGFALELLIEYRLGKIEIATARYRMDQLLGRIFNYQPGLKPWLQRRMASSALMLPGLAYRLLAMGYRLGRGQPIQNHPAYRHADARPSDRL
jgi:hypothetical protein